MESAVEIVRFREGTHRALDRKAGLLPYRRNIPCRSKPEGRRAGFTHIAGPRLMPFVSEAGAGWLRGRSEDICQTTFPAGVGLRSKRIRLASNPAYRAEVRIGPIVDRRAQQRVTGVPDGWIKAR